MKYIIILFLLFHYGSSEEYTKSVNTSWGVVIGELVSPGTNDLPPVTQYLGIPYGSPPILTDRFNMVKSASKWTHNAKDTRTLSPSCIQSLLPELNEREGLLKMSSQRFDFIHRLYPKLKHESENCLYMNIFVPERLQVNKLSVLVLIHGDDYGWGSGGPFNGTTLASYGQIIVVTLNYRLGVFGFLGRCESSSCKGNEGMADIVSSLTMISGMISSFGGNPREVTLMGWGSGGSIVSLLMASPMTAPSRRLFKRAILLDGTALAPNALSHDPQGYFLQLAEKLKCSTKATRDNPSSVYNGGVEEIIKCIQEQSSDNITKAAHQISYPSFLSSFAPIVDGQLVPNYPQTIFAPQYGTLFRDIDLLVGTTTHPAHHLMSNRDLNQGISTDQRKKILRTFVRNLYRFHRTEILSAIENEYTNWNNPVSNSRYNRDSIISILSDSLFVSPLIKTLRAHSSDETSRDSKTFFFHFGHETRSWAAEQPNSGIRGSYSGDHIPYILGYPLSRIDNDEKLYSRFDNEDRGISKVMMTYVSNFVRSGDPSQPNGISNESPIEEAFKSVTWPQYNQPNREAYMEIGVNRDKPASVKNFYRNAHVGFWNGLIPQLHSSGKEGITVPEEHNFLPDHFKSESFYGNVRPYSSYSNIPFPPPPPIPTQPPSLKKTTPVPLDSSETVSPTSLINESNSYSTMLSMTVAIGCGLLLLNICVFFGMYRTCNKDARAKKKLQLQYQTYSSNHGQNPDLHYSINSPLVALPSPPHSMKPSNIHPPSISNDSQSLIDESLPIYTNGIVCGSISRNGYQRGRNTSFTLPSYPSPSHLIKHQEQEPLLSANQNTSIGGIRPGVSPTCPRHGRSAMTTGVSSSRGNSVISGGTLGGSTIGRDNICTSIQSQPIPIEEIQV